MERTVPSTASEEVELYLRTYYSLLRTTAEVQIRTLEEAHAGMNSLLHPGARETAPDMAAFIYSILRLPPEILNVRLVVLGQSLEVFSRGGYERVERWQPTCASARRRRCYYNGQDIMACFIASRSDIDDVIPLLTAFQIEWNKFHSLLQMMPASIKLERFEEDPALQQTLADLLQITWDDLQRLYAVWRSDFIPNLQLIKEAPRWLRVQLLSGSFTEYRRATNDWWEQIEDYIPDIRQRPVYFISSNSHSISNVLTGFGLQHQEGLLEFIKRSENKALLHEWEAIQAGKVPSSRENFLYYALKKYQGTEEGRGLIEKQSEDEKAIGLHRILNEYSFDVEAQVIELSKLKPDWFDPRLPQGDYLFFNKSEALILNIDYPLGLSAYNILSKVAESVGKVTSVYMMGKAATLNGVVGDVMIPNVVHDEHSQNTYIFQNCFSAADVAPYLVYGTVLDNQKAVTVQGTFLQNARYMDVFYREGYTDIEMESGSYLSAVYEMFRPKRHPMNEIVNLYGVSFDVGIIHYVSDTPLGKGRNLGAGSLSYFGMDSTYAATLAILHRILLMERARLSA
jgi:hypothetical protein